MTIDALMNTYNALNDMNKLRPEQLPAEFLNIKTKLELALNSDTVSSTPIGNQNAWAMRVAKKIHPNDGAQAQVMYNQIVSHFETATSWVKQGWYTLTFASVKKGLTATGMDVSALKTDFLNCVYHPACTTKMLIDLIDKMQKKLPNLVYNETPTNIILSKNATGKLYNEMLTLTFDALKNAAGKSFVGVLVLAAGVWVGLSGGDMRKSNV